MTDQDAIECMKLIDELRAEEFDSVEIEYDNPNCHDSISCVRVYGDWVRIGYTNRITGDSVLDCLRKAVEAKRKAEGNVQN